jgi:hypothetical protein
MGERTSLLPDINAHKIKIDGNILDSEDEEELTFEQFKSSKHLKGAKSVANFEIGDKHTLEVAAISKSENKIKKGSVVPSEDYKQLPSEGTLDKDEGS